MILCKFRNFHPWHFSHSVCDAWKNVIIYDFSAAQIYFFYVSQHFFKVLMLLLASILRE